MITHLPLARAFSRWVRQPWLTRLHTFSYSHDARVDARRTRGTALPASALVALREASQNVRKPMSPNLKTVETVSPRVLLGVLEPSQMGGEV